VNLDAAAWPFPPVGGRAIHLAHRLVGGQTPLNRAGIVIAGGELSFEPRDGPLRGRAGPHAVPQRRDIVVADPPDRDPKRAAQPQRRAIPAFIVIATLTNTGGRIEVPMKKRLDSWRNHLRTAHIDVAHAAEFAALVVAVQLAAGLCVEAVACRLLRALDDDPFPL